MQVTCVWIEVYFTRVLGAVRNGRISGNFVALGSGRWIERAYCASARRWQNAVGGGSLDIDELLNAVTQKEAAAARSQSLLHSSSCDGYIIIIFTTSLGSDAQQGKELLIYYRWYLFTVL